MDFEGDRLVTFDCGEHGPSFVLPRCSKCCRFLKHGKMLVNTLGDIKLEGWVCAKHGEVMPYDYGWLDWEPAPSKAR